MTDGNIRTDIDGIVYPGDEFIQFLEQAVTSGQLSTCQVHAILQKLCFHYR